MNLLFSNFLLFSLSPQRERNQQEVMGIRQEVGSFCKPKKKKIAYNKDRISPVGRDSGKVCLGHRSSFGLERVSETKSQNVRWVCDGEVTPTIWSIFKKYGNQDKIFGSIIVKELLWSLFHHGESYIFVGKNCWRKNWGSCSMTFIMVQNSRSMKDWTTGWIYKQILEGGKLYKLK